MKEKFLQIVRTERGYVTESGFVFQLCPYSGEAGEQMRYRVLYPYYDTSVYLSQELFEQEVPWDRLEAFGAQDMVRLFWLTGYLEAGEFEIRVFRSAPECIKVRNPIGLEVDIELEEKDRATFFHSFYQSDRYFAGKFWASSNPNKFVVLARRPSTFLPENEVPYTDSLLQQNLGKWHVNEQYMDGLDWDGEAYQVDGFWVKNVHGVDIRYDGLIEGYTSWVVHPTENISLSLNFKEPSNVTDFVQLFEFDSIGSYESFYQLFLWFGNISINGVCYTLSYSHGHIQVQAVYCGEEDGWFKGTKCFRFPHSSLNSLPDMIRFTQQLREQH